MMLTMKNREALLNARKKTGLKINAEKAKYMFIHHYWNTGYKHMTVDKSSENVAHLKFDLSLLMIKSWHMDCINKRGRRSNIYSIS
jgi:hypothetical protein